MTDFYAASSVPSTGSALSSSVVRAEFALIAAAFVKVAPYTGHGGEIVAINAGGTAQESLATTGTGNVVRAIGATLTNATLVNPALGTPASGVATNLTGTATALNIGGNAATATTATTATNLSGTPTFFAPITASLAADVALNNTANYFDGPNVAQGLSGKWFVSGKVTVADTVASKTFKIKLWDGATVIDSALIVGSSVGVVSLYHATASLSGFISDPAGNLRISVQDVSTVNGLIVYNASGHSKDSTITAVRIG